MRLGALSGPHFRQKRPKLSNLRPNSINELKFAEISRNSTKMPIFLKTEKCFLISGKKKKKLLFSKILKLMFCFFFLIRRHLCIYVAYMCTLFPGGIEPQPIKLEFTIYPAELWIWEGLGVRA